MNVHKTVFLTIVISCILSSFAKAEEPTKNPNQDAILSYETEIYGIPLQDMIPAKSPIHNCSLRSEMGKNAHRAKDSRIFHITKEYFLWWSYNITIQKTDTFLYDAMEDYSSIGWEHNQTETLKYHICEGTALLCGNVELRPHIFSGSSLEWRSAVLFGSNDLSDCEKLRAFMHEYNQLMLEKHTQ